MRHRLTNGAARGWADVAAACRVPAPRCRKNALTLHRVGVHHFPMTTPFDTLDRNRAVVVAFVKRLRDLIDLNPQRFAQVRAPEDVESGPYADARIAVDGAMSTAGRGPSARMREFAQQADGLISKHNLPPEIAALAQAAVAAILVRNLPGQERNLTTIYAPFEPVVPFTSLTLSCPVCGAASDGGYSIGDDTLFICPRCGGYRVSGTAIAMLEKGTLRRPDPERFRDLVKRKRGASSEYPAITSGDLGG